MEPQDLVFKHIKFLPKHIAFLEKEFDNNNISNACRLAIEKLMVNHKNLFLEKYLLIFAFGLVLIVFGTVTLPLYVSATFLSLGVIFIMYSIVMLTFRRIGKL